MKFKPHTAGQRKPRNPIAMPARRRAAGAHRARDARQQAAQALRRELERLVAHGP